MRNYDEVHSTLKHELSDLDPDSDGKVMTGKYMTLVKIRVGYELYSLQELHVSSDGCPWRQYSQ